jgi:hypothetical protein
MFHDRIPGNGKFLDLLLLDARFLTSLPNKFRDLVPDQARQCFVAVVNGILDPADHIGAILALRVDIARRRQTLAGSHVDEMCDNRCRADVDGDAERTAFTAADRFLRSGCGLADRHFHFFGQIDIHRPRDTRLTGEYFFPGRGRAHLAFFAAAFPAAGGIKKNALG